MAPVVLPADATDDECRREVVRQSWWRAQYDMTRRLLMDRHQESWNLDHFAEKLAVHFTPDQRRRMAYLLRASADRTDAGNSAYLNPARRTITKSNTNRRQGQQCGNRQSTHPRWIPSTVKRQGPKKPEASKWLEAHDAEPEVEPMDIEKRDSLGSENGTSSTSEDYPAERFDPPEPDSVNSENDTSSTSDIPEWEESL